MSKNNYLCSVCGGSFSSIFNLKKHVKAKHPSHLDELNCQRKNIFDFVCYVCSRKFHHKRNLRRHIHLEHGAISKDIIKTEVESDGDYPYPADDHNYMDPAIQFERDDLVDDSEFMCGSCGGIFSTLFNLRKHVRSKHPDLLDTIAPRKKIGQFVCDECGRKFTQRKSLGRHRLEKHKSSTPELKECPDCGKSFLNLVNFHKHVKNKHPNSMATLILKGIKVGEFSCNICNKVFSQRKNLRRHMLGKHKETSAYSGKAVAIYQCPLCPFNKSGDVSIIINHFKLSHDIEVNSKEKEFNSFKSFAKWKEEMEQATKSSYVKKAHVGLTSYFRCHRSGKYKPRGNGIRNLKIQGSNKIGGFCPAGMQVRVTGNTYFVKYSDTHVGHTKDLKHLKLSKRERQSLASEIAAQVSLDEILTNVRKSAGTSEEELARMSLVTKQDLTNIMRQYQLEGTAVRHTVKAESLDAWLLISRQNVLYYKPQNCSDPEQPTLSSQDFVLIIMTEAQRDIFTRFGGGCVCLDRTYVSGTRFSLSTIMVVDGVRAGFPTAFLISNRMDADVLEFFFITVRHFVGEITPGLLLTDVAEDYYTAWVNVMGDPGQTLFCLWQVERDWRDNLYSMAEESKRAETYLTLRHLMTDDSIELFEHNLRDTSMSLTSDPETYAFGLYFTKNYSENYRYWSKAFRPEDALSVDSDLERLHYSLKYLYTEVKRFQRLDKTIDSIMEFIDNKLFERITNIEKSTNKKLKNIISGHRSSLYLNIKNICKINNSWYISQVDKMNSDYRVDEINPNCDCELKCDVCNVCLHRFTCTCADSVLKFNMCRHIHLVCQFIGTNGSSDAEEVCIGEDDYIGEIVIMDGEEIKSDMLTNFNIKTEESQVSNIILSESSQNQILNEKKVMIASLSNEILQSINSVDEGDAFIQILQAAKPTVASVHDEGEKTVYIETGDSSNYHRVLPVKRILYTATCPDESSNSSEPGSYSANSIEAHITLDSDGITLLSQAANFANATNN